MAFENPAKNPALYYTRRPYFRNIGGDHMLYEGDTIEQYREDFHKVPFVYRPQIAAATFGLLTYGVGTKLESMKPEIFNDSHLAHSSIEPVMKKWTNRFNIIYSHTEQKYLIPGTPLVFVGLDGKPIINPYTTPPVDKKPGNLFDFWRQHRQLGMEMLFIHQNMKNPLAIVNFFFKVATNNALPSFITAKRSIYVHPDHQHKGIGHWINLITDSSMSGLQALLGTPIMLSSDINPNNTASQNNAKKLYGNNWAEMDIGGKTKIVFFKLYS